MDNAHISILHESFKNECKSKHTFDQSRNKKLMKESKNFKTSRLNNSTAVLDNIFKKQY